MKANELEVGKFYRAKVSGKLTTVQLVEIKSQQYYAGLNPYSDVTKYKYRTVYRVQNVNTNRETVFKSAAKFRYEAEQRVSIRPKTVTVEYRTEKSEPIANHRHHAVGALSHFMSDNGLREAYKALDSISQEAAFKGLSTTEISNLIRQELDRRFPNEANEQKEEQDQDDS